VVATDDRTATYRAEDIQMHRPALAQVLNPGLPHAARLRYLEAVRAWGRLSHPSLLAVLDILQDEDGLTIAILESPTGPTLKEVCRQASEDGRLPVEAAAEVAEQLLEALAYLHGQGLVHGELRPENVFWNGRLKIAVAGVAPVYVQGSSAIWVGPAAYRAPEQLAGQPAGPQADLYSAGLILYQALSGVHPFESESGEVVALRQASAGPPTRLNLYRPAVPPRLESVVLKLMEADTTARFASAEEARRALAADG
jgi:eukaryotic-like serine/threonine-protein kinase